MDTSIILDRILLFAVHKAYTLRDGLMLLHVAPRIETPSTHRAVMRRLVPANALVRTDLLAQLGHLPSGPTLENIVLSAAAAGQVDVLEYLHARDRHRQIIFRPLPTNWPWCLSIGDVFIKAVTHGQLAVMDWIINVCDASLVTQMLVNDAFVAATSASQVPSLTWLKAHAAAHGLEYDFEPYMYRESQPTPAPAHQVAMLDWWWAELAARQPSNRLTMFDAFHRFLPECATVSHTTMDWWRDRCAEAGHTFSWPILNRESLRNLIASGDLELCRWWWADTALQLRRVSRTERRQHRVPMDLHRELDTMCEFNRVDFLEWYWELHESGEIAFPKGKWRPRRPFFHLDVIQWWSAPERDCGDVFRIVPAAVGCTPLDALMTRPVYSKVDIEALDWWWTRRDQFGLEANLSQSVLQDLVMMCDPDLLQWYLARCTPRSPLPHVGLTAFASLVARGHAHVLEELWDQSQALASKLQMAKYNAGIDVRYFDGSVSLPVVLDCLWESYECAGLSIGRLFEPKSVLEALGKGQIDAVGWWYAMHCVHGTPFPLAEDLVEASQRSNPPTVCADARQTLCVRSTAMAPWQETRPIQPLVVAVIGSLQVILADKPSAGLDPATRIGA
ncbi:hypothetical protein BC828DRAFT_408253 [Blastocladiella britannica]|nr:hypothetical protein BC828DRAFT_408253 [Blastocladiella britannica]